MNPQDERLDEQTFNGDEDSAQTMSLMGGIAGPEGMAEAETFGETSDGGSQLLNQSTMLVLLLALIAGGALYAMRVGRRSLAPNAEARQIEQKIEATLDRLNEAERGGGTDPLQPGAVQSLFDDTESVVAVFVEDLTRRQVPPEFIKKNPFRLPMFRRATAREAPQPVSEEELERQRLAERRTKLEQELAMMKLQSVVGGPRPVAIIDGELVQPGQSVGSFEVTSIENLTVHLEAEEFEFTLTMDRGGGRGGQPSPRTVQFR